MNPFDFYIYIDYSENYVGYTIIENEKVKTLSLKVTKLKHYRTVKHKKEYLKAAKNLFEREKIIDLLFKY